MLLYFTIVRPIPCPSHYFLPIVTFYQYHPNRIYRCYVIRYVIFHRRHSRVSLEIECAKKFSPEKQLQRKCDNGVTRVGGNHLLSQYGSLLLSAEGEIIGKSGALFVTVHLSPSQGLAGSQLRQARGCRAPW